MFDETVGYPSGAFPCPFCQSGPPHLSLQRQRERRAPDMFRVHCLGCLADGPYSGAVSGGKAIELWNESLGGPDAE